LALVTGAGAGIGRAVVLTLADLGASVVALDIDAAGVGAVVEEVAARGGEANAVTFDLTRTGEIEELVAEITTDLGPVSVLVNNAARFGRAVMETTIEDWERVFAVNVTAPFVLIRAIGALMAEAGGGNIVNISSSSAFRASSSGGPYGASKAALGALTRAAAWELGPFNVNVNAVAPGVTRTAVTARAFGDAPALDAAVASGPLANLLRRVSEPEDVANVVAFLCLPASRQITAQVIHTSAGAVV
jgi:NAD(P)-dependent dehydrogenase (short-subunit alcohol dehydrogenase family)